MAPFYLCVNVKKNFFMIPYFSIYDSLPVPDLKHELGATIALNNFYDGNPKLFNEYIQFTCANKIQENFCEQPQQREP